MSRGQLDNTDYAGRGLGFGAGAQVKGKVPLLGFLFWPLFFVKDLPGPKVMGALFVDGGVDFYRMQGGGNTARPSIDGRLTSLTVGFGLGSDF